MCLEIIPLHSTTELVHKCNKTMYGWQENVLNYAPVYYLDYRGLSRFWLKLSTLSRISVKSIIEEYRSRISIIETSGWALTGSWLLIPHPLTPDRFIAAAFYKITIRMFKSQHMSGCRMQFVRSSLKCLLYIWSGLVSLYKPPGCPWNHS